MPPTTLTSGGADGAPANNNNEEVLELYRGEIEDLRRQLRESQEARHREEEAQREIAELRRQLSEARLESTSAKEVTQLTSTVAAKDAEAVTNAIKYLDAVIHRVSSKSKSKSRTKTTRTRKGVSDNDDTKEASNTSDDVESTPLRTNKQVVELEFCPSLPRQISTPTLHQLSTDNDDDSGSWQPAGTMKRLVDDMSSVATSSLAGADGAPPSVRFGPRSVLSSMYGTASGCASSASASSWRPTGAMAALVAGMPDDSTVNTWLTAGEDDFEDMQTCVSALTNLTGGKSRGTPTGGSNASKTTTTTTKDDTAVVVSQLYHIQRLLLTVLKDKENASKNDTSTIGFKEKDRHEPSVEEMSSRAKMIANLWENQLDGEKCTGANSDRDANMKEKASTTLTKEDAKQVIASLAGLF